MARKLEYLAIPHFLTDGETCRRRHCGTTSVADGIDERGKRRRLLEDAGFTIVSKDEDIHPIELPVSPEDRLWTEGKPHLVAHLRRERASGLAQAKKDWFARTHGRLFCERCGLDPVVTYDGAHGNACIEVHHEAVQVEDMAEGHKTKLEDLQCLCANCHRVAHRLLKLKQTAFGSKELA